jgi:cytochrome c biogenesis protein CcmG/thiol:disulfide interchange protein DsbE
MSATAVSLPKSINLTRGVVILIAGSLGALVLFFALVFPKSHSSVNASAPNFTLASVDGNSKVSLAMRNGHPAVINFFASWCVPCRRELPRLSAAATKNQDIQFIGIDDQDSRNQALDLLAASAVSFPSGYDPKASVAPKYGITTGLPSTVFIDKDGKIVYTQFGEISDEKLSEQLDRLVAK